MTILSDVQTAFASSLYGTASKQPIVSFIQPHQRVPAQTQFAIYQHSIRNRFTKALRAIYPVCEKLVGTDFFSELAEQYIQATPATSYDLNAYGASLAAFIAHYAPAKPLSYYSDVARLEWAWHRLYGAPDCLGFDFHKLATLMQQTDELYFTLPPRATLLQSPYPIHHIWEINQPEATANQLVLENNAAYYIYIWHHQDNFRIQAINAIEWQVLTWLHEQRSLTAVCDLIAVEFPLWQPAEHLPDWIAAGWLGNVDLVAN